MKTDTLSFRIFLFTSIWMLVSLIVVAVLVLQDYRNTMERQFEDLITANLYNLMGTVSRNDEGGLQGEPQLGDNRYRQFESGWYWSVQSVENPQSRKSSDSLAGARIPASTATDNNSVFQQAFRIIDHVKNNILVVEEKVYLGEGDDLYTFRATGNLAVLDDEIGQFSRRLILFLAIAGIGLVLASLAIVRFGLKPIASATDQLTDIRNGKKDRIEGDYPLEIAPLIDETNALIRSNQAIVERSRTQVGNLAHSLKTPLSVLSLEVEGLPKTRKTKMHQQLLAMKTQIQTYLNRAMISARHGTITSRTDIYEIISKYLRTFNKLFPDIEFVFEDEKSLSNKINNGETYIFSGEEHDFEEMIGNILENAGKFARNSVTVSCTKTTSDNRNWIDIDILDDGPGLKPVEIEFVLKRGNRLDENKPGTGLGLSIVGDILKEYQGELKLSSQGDGGLRVSLRIPAAV